MSGHKKAALQDGLKETNQQRNYSTVMHAMSSPVLQSLAVLFVLFALLVQECAL